MELRYLRFAYVRGISLLSERVLGPLRLKHFLYLFLSVLALWRGLGGSPQALALSVAVGALALASAVYPPRSMSFESYLLALLLSLADLLAGRKAARVRPPGAERRRSGTVAKPEESAVGAGGPVAVAGVALAVAGTSMLVLGVLLRHPLVLVAGGLPLGLGLALALGRALRG